MKPDMAKVLVGGLVASVAFAVMIYLIAPLLVGHTLDIGNIPVDMAGAGAWGLGIVTFVILGVIAFPIAYGSVVYRIFMGLPWFRGMSFGMALWIITMLVIVPIAGGGMFYQHAGGTAAALFSLAAFALYGTLLGGVGGYGVAPEEAQA